MPTRHWPEKASIRGAFFILTLWLSSSPVTADCPQPANSQTVRVSYVYDGDTVVLADNRRVRLIGINTPEIGHKGQPNQPLAIRARDRLRQLLFSAGNKVRLQPGEQPKDRHGRVLAHLYLADESQVAEILIREGMGWFVAVAPNLTAANCLKSAEKVAQDKGLGVWSKSRYVPLNAKDLKLKKRGFQLVRGQITSVSDHHSARWLTLGNRLIVNIPANALAQFDAPPTAAWAGKTIEVRGWLYPKQGKLRVNLEHPTALQVIPDKVNDDTGTKMESGSIAPANK